MAYNLQSEYLELCFKYLSFLYDFVFFACGVPVFLWNYFNHLIYQLGWCTSEPAYTEFLVILPFLTAWLLLQKITFLPFRLYETFVIEYQAGYNKMTYGTYMCYWIKGIVVYIIMYWALIMLALTLIKVCGDYLVITFGFATLVISIFMVLIYPICIAPIFNSYDELKDEEFGGIR